MRAELTIEGGVGFFPGLARPIVVEANELSPADNEELSRLVSAARAQSAAAPRAAQKPVPDGRTYRIVIVSDDGSTELGCADPSVPPAFSALMVFIKKHGHR
ncbi:protealysin inhibitor emfourin [Caballeronia concitans]|uniref:Uncharacterized protein n=1 Tax=Caballeronia concitans TaxID=1777133 RepID=A0A658QX80_9BURK|nr:protealysin inhibitor emfourin [Caballeronia concitans]KIG03027.1 hypothetical protein BurMR1_4889 [Burkholderia sp. MR1]SAL30542.1 hypothetical protein AWB72_02599 [Caballeronia concitans]